MHPIPALRGLGLWHRSLSYRFEYQCSFELGLVIWMLGQPIAEFLND